MRALSIFWYLLNVFRDLKFLLYRTCLVRGTPRYCILYVTIVKGDSSLISFLPVCQLYIEELLNVFELILHPATLLKVFVGCRSSLVEFWKLLMHTIMPSANGSPLLTLCGGPDTRDWVTQSPRIDQNMAGKKEQVSGNISNDRQEPSIITIREAPSSKQMQKPTAKQLAKLGESCIRGRQRIIGYKGVKDTPGKLTELTSLDSQGFTDTTGLISREPAQV